MTKKQNAGKKPISVKIHPQLKQELANYAQNKGIPQVKVLEDALASYKHALSSKDKRFKKKLETEFVPRIKGREKAVFTARIDQQINDELDSLCKETLKTKSYIIENAIFWKLYVTNNGTLNGKIDEGKRRTPELPKKLMDSNTVDEVEEEPDDREGAVAEQESAETGTE